MTVPGSPDAADIRRTVEKILAAPRFVQNRRSADLLRRIVEETLAGRGEALNTDSIAPKQAARLRTCLDEYYAAEGADDPVRIVLPEGSCRPDFQVVATPSRRRWPKFAAAAVVLAALAACAAYVWHLNRRGHIDSIAVLPFAQLAPAAGPSWLADSVTEEVIDALSRVPGLRTVGRDSAFSFQGKTQEIVAAELHAAAVLQGGVRQSGDRIYITVELNRPSDGYHFWSHTFDRPLREVPAVALTLARDVAGLLPTSKYSPRTPRDKPALPAYRAYLEGRSLFHRDDPASLRQAIERFTAATDSDPKFALAWAWLSIAGDYLVEMGAARPNEIMPASRDAAERAVALDPDAADAHTALGIVKLQYDWDWDGAKGELDRALPLSPGSSFVHRWRGRWFESQAKLDDAMTELRQALELDPSSPDILVELASLSAFRGQGNQALGYVERAAALVPAAQRVRLVRIQALTAAGRRDEALAALKSFQPATPLMNAMATAFSADIGSADPLLESADELRSATYAPAFGFAMVAAAIRETGDAFRWLDAAYDERSLQMPYWRLWVPTPPSDPRYADLQARLDAR